MKEKLYKLKRSGWPGEERWFAGFNETGEEIWHVYSEKARIFTEKELNELCSKDESFEIHHVISLEDSYDADKLEIETHWENYYEANGYS